MFCAGKSIRYQRNDGEMRIIKSHTRTLVEKLGSICADENVDL